MSVPLNATPLYDNSTAPAQGPILDWTMNDYSITPNGSGHFVPLTSDVEHGWDFKLINIAFNSNALPNYPYQDINSSGPSESTIDEAMTEVYSPFIVFLDWIGVPEVFEFLPWHNRSGPRLPYLSDLSELEAAFCPQRRCSSFDDCLTVYAGLDQTLRRLDASNLNGYEAGEFEDIVKTLTRSLYKSNHSKRVFNCPILLANVTSYSIGLFDHPIQQCTTPSLSSWTSSNADFNLAVFKEGGVDDDGNFYPGIADAALSSMLRQAFLEGSSSNCTMESVCEPPTACEQVGTSLTLSPKKSRFRSAWAYNVLTAIANINQQLFNQYEALQSAAVEDALAAFNIDD